MLMSPLSFEDDLIAVLGHFKVGLGYALIPSGIVKYEILGLEIEREEEK